MQPAFKIISKKVQLFHVHADLCHRCLGEIWRQALPKSIWSTLSIFAIWHRDPDKIHSYFRAALFNIKTVKGGRHQLVAGSKTNSSFSWEPDPRFFGFSTLLLCWEQSKQERTDYKFVLYDQLEWEQHQTDYFYHKFMKFHTHGKDKIAAEI